MISLFTRQPRMDMKCGFIYNQKGFYEIKEGTLMQPTQQVFHFLSDLTTVHNKKVYSKICKR